MDEAFKIFAFVIATAISIASLHLSLVRLSISVDDELKERERGGVLIVIQFSLVAILCSTIPMVINILQPSSPDPYLFGSWFTPILIFLIAALDLWRTHSDNRDCYYNITVSLVLLLSALLILMNHIQGNTRLVFLLSLAVALLVTASQLFKSALRVGKIIS